MSWAGDQGNGGRDEHGAAVVNKLRRHLLRGAAITAAGSRPLERQSDGSIHEGFTVTTEPGAARELNEAHVAAIEANPRVRVRRIVPALRFALSKGAVIRASSSSPNARVLDANPDGSVEFGLEIIYPGTVRQPSDEMAASTA